MRRLAVLLAALALVGAACAGDDDGESSAGTTPDEPTTTTAVDPTTVAARPSAGCGSSSVVAGETNETVVSSGRDRAYTQHVPPAHDGTTPLPVIFDYHGYAEGGPIHVLHTALGPYGDEEGFVTISPDSGYEVPTWNLNPGSEDVVMFGDLLDQVESTLCIDTARVYVAGLSYGAFMTSTLGCEHSDRIAAIAPVAGLQNPDGCQTERPLPVIAFHGTADTFIAFEGGFGESVGDLPQPDGSGTLGDDAEDGDAEEAEADEGPSITDNAIAWAERNGCVPELESETVAADVELQSGIDCPAGGEVDFYVVDGGGHTWPGSTFDDSIVNIVGPVTHSIDANELMWEFFQARPLLPEP